MSSRNTFLRSLGETALAAFSASLETVSLKAGADLYQPDDPVDWVYFPETGLISLISVLEDGEQAESAVVGREGAVGLIEAAGSGVMLYRAVVQIDLTAQRATIRDYMVALNASPSMRRAIAVHLELVIAESRQMIACQNHHAAPERLAWWLLECQDRTGLDEFPLTQEFLGAMLGVQRTTVNASARRLKDQGAIRYRRNRIEVTDREALKRQSCECYETIAGYRRRIEGINL